MIDRIKFYFRHYSFLLNNRRILISNILQRKLDTLRGLHQLSPEQLQNIPIIINNFNRLNCLQILIKRLEKSGLRNIIILDNASAYPPLLEYYKTCPYRVHRLTENLGFLALWNCGLYEKEFSQQYYILTDPDVVPDENCPDDLVQHLYSLLQKYPALDKAGLSLKIEDIPDHYTLKQKVLEIEIPFWKKCINNAYYQAPIDTTFALYRPGVKGGFWLNSGRSMKPYIALHLPWYADSSKPDEEELFYREHAVYSKNWS